MLRANPRAYTTLALIALAGLAGIASVDAQAENSRESHAASYRHFQNKESLLAAVAQQGFDLLAEAMRSSVRFAGPDPFAKLQAAGVAYVDFGLQHPQHLTAMFSGAVANFDDHPGLKAAAKAAQDELQAAVRAVSQGVAMGAAEEDTVGAAAWAIVHGLTVLLVDGQLRVREGGRVTKQQQMKLAGAVTALFCKGLQGLLRRD